MRTSAFASSDQIRQTPVGQAKAQPTFVDNRPAAAAQRKLAELANNGPQAMQQKSVMEQIKGSSPDAAVQRKTEEEPLQGKFETAQLAGDKEREEEKPLQGKFGSEIPAQVPTQAPAENVPSTNETAVPDTEEKLTPEAIEAKHKAADLRIDEAKKSCKDSTALQLALDQIKLDLGLKAIEIDGIGTPAANVRYQVNPWFHNSLSGTQMAHKMAGRSSPAITNVQWLSENLTIGTKTARVGKRMVAAPLAPDYEAGSESSNDKDQNGIMGELLNAGTTSVGNDKKYIKGHLLNDNTGGPGVSFNLFPITADANAKHLAYVEKFVKSQLNADNVVSYEVQVTHKAPVDLSGSGTGPYGIDAKFDFYWHLLDMFGNKFGSAHGGSIESIVNAYGVAPFDVTTEYAGEYDKVNRGKVTPSAKQQSGQWQESSISQIGKTSGSVGSTLDSSLTSPSGFFGSSSSSSNSSSSSVTLHDFTDVVVKSDSSGFSFISMRNGHLPSPLATGNSVKVGSSSAPKIVKISSISPMSGGWTRIYF